MSLYHDLARRAVGIDDDVETLVSLSDADFAALQVVELLHVFVIAVVDVSNARCRVDVLDESDNLAVIPTLLHGLGLQHRLARDGDRLGVEHACACFVAGT